MSIHDNVCFDDILLQVGEFGRHQKRIYFLLFLPTIFSGMHKLAWVFLGANVDHRCLLPQESEYNVQFGTNASKTFPYRNVGQCMYEDEAGNQFHCNRGWVYDTSVFGSSAVMEFNLVCDDKYKSANAQALFMVGVLIGSYLFGDLSDRLGRKPVFFSSVLLQGIIGILAGFAPNYSSFVALRLIIGMTTSGVFLVSYVLAMEMVGKSYRVLAGTLCHYYYTVGFFIMAIIAFFLNYDWRLLQIVLSLPTLGFVIYWWVMPESVRWLIRKGRNEEAKRYIMDKVARENRAMISEGMVDEMINAEKRKYEGEESSSCTGILDLLSYPVMRRRAFNIFFQWFVISGSYYGLSLGASDLSGGNPYISFILSAAVEIPAYLINIAVMNRPFFGRKRTLSGLMLLAGLTLLALIFIPSTQTELRTGLVMTGKLAITSSYCVIYIMSAEIFPTEVRNAGIGASSMCARIGGILCPYVNLMAEYWLPLPGIVYGSLAVASGLLATLLPETLQKQLPESLQDGETFV